MQDLADTRASGAGSTSLDDILDSDSETNPTDVENDQLSDQTELGRPESVEEMDPLLAGLQEELFLSPKPPRPHKPWTANTGSTRKVDMTRAQLLKEQQEDPTLEELWTDAAESPYISHGG